MKTLEDALAAIEEMKAAHEDEKAAILKKNKELVDREKLAKTAAQEAEDARKEAAREAAAKNGDLEALKASLEKKHAKELDTFKAQLEGANSRLSGLLIDGEISKALVGNNVPAHLHAPLTAMFKAQAKLGNDGVALHGDQPLAEYLPAFFTSDDGKAFVSAPVNVGTGSTGVRNANAHGYTQDTWTLTEASKIARENPALAKAIDTSMEKPLGL